MSVAGATTVVGYGATDVGNDNTLKPSDHYAPSPKGKRKAGVGEGIILDESIAHSTGMVSSLSLANRFKTLKHQFLGCRFPGRTPFLFQNHC